MLLLKRRYVSQCDWGITLTVTWAQDTHTQNRLIADYPQDLKSKSVFLRLLHDISTLLDIHKRKNKIRHERVEQEHQ